MKDQKQEALYLGMDKDSDGRVMNTAEGFHPHAENIHMEPLKIPSSMDGTIAVDTPLPLGNNTPNGSYWDRRGDTRFDFWHNSLGNHSITRHHIAQGYTTVIAQSPLLAFYKVFLITGIGLVDNQYLYWMNDLASPMCIDLQRAEDDGTKKSVIRVYLPVSDDTQQRLFGVSVVSPTGTTVSATSSLHTSTAAEVLAFSPMLEAVAAAFNAGFSTWFTATACNSYIEFESANTGLWRVTLRFTDTTGSGVQPQVIAKQETRNRYALPWVREQLDMAAFMPPYPPANTVINDPSRTVNMIGKRIFRFAYSYIFRDRGNSPLSPWSLPAYIPATCSSGVGSNTISVDISADYNLNPIGSLSEIDCIELFYQESTDAGWGVDWKSAGIFTKDKWIYPLSFQFANDTTPVIVDRAYSGIFAWSVPLAAKATAQIVDQDSNNRILIGNTVEGYETPCVNVDLQLDIAASIGSRTTVDIEVWVLVGNMYANYGLPGFWSNQPIWQRNTGVYRIGGMGLAVVGAVQFDSNDCDQITVTGGFPVYIAGTGFLAITEQVVPSASSTSVNFVPDTTVLDGTNLGASLNPANTSGRTAISLLTAGGDIYNRAIIKGVPSGQEVCIRVADTKCGFFNDSSILDLNNPDLTYQSTSDKIIGNIPSPAATSLSRSAREIKVDIPLGATGTIFAGQFVYADCCVPEPLAIKSLTLKGYGFDDNGDDYSPGNDIRVTGTSMERTWYGLFPFDPITGQPPTLGITLILSNAPGAQFWAANGIAAATQIFEQAVNVSDHNGFYFLPVRKAFNSIFLEYNWRMATVSISGDPATPVGVFAGYTASGIQVLNLTVLNDFADNKWIGTLSDAVLTGPGSGNLDKSGRFKDYIIANVNPDARAKIRTHVKGAVIDQDGNPIPNVPVVMETGRWLTTDQFGFYDTPVYGSMNRGWIIGNNLNDRNEDGVFFMWNGTCDANFIGGNFRDASLVDIYRFWEGPGFSDVVGLTLAPQTIDLTPQAQGPFLKRWATYDVGAIWIDQHGRPSPVQFLKRFDIPGITDDLHGYDPVTWPIPLTFRRGLPSISWDILSNVEIPAYGRFRRLQFVITQNQGYSKWLQWSPSHALYVSRWDNSTHLPVITSPSSGSAREIYLGFTDGFQRYRELNSGTATLNSSNVTEQFGQIGWLWQRGDRMRIITNSNGAYQASTIDVEIIGQYGIYLIIENASNIPEMKGGEVVELYRPGVLPGEAKNYREIPGAYAEVSDPFGTPSWVSTTGLITGADSWNIATQIPVRPGYVSDTATPNVPWSSRAWLRESMAVTDFWTSTVDGLGRVAIEDPQASQKRRGTAIRVSNPYQPGTARNGIRLFEPLNIKVANTDYGLIQFMEEMDMVVVIPCSAARTFAIYISRTLLTSGDDDLITIGNQILGTMRPMAKRFGTVNPESMVRGDTFMFWVDAITGAIVRYDVNGVKSVSRRGINNWFAEYCRRITQYPDYRFYGGINTSFSEYWVTIKPVSKVVNGIDDTAGGETIVFWYADSDENETANKFSCMVTAVSGYYGRSSGRMFSMKDNEVWLHDADPDNQNVIHGVRRPLAVEIMFNADPSRKKIFLALQADSGSGWYCPNIRTAGQFSNLIKEDFVVDQGISKAPVLRDVNTPVPNAITKGDPMVGTTISVLFRNDCTDGKVTLASTGMHHRGSPET